MSKILKRPMFRRGGEVDGGIMTGIQTRSNNQNAGLAGRFESYRDLLQSVAPTTTGVDPVAKFLISGGLRGLSQTGGGGTLANLAKAFEAPTQQLFTDIEARGKPQQALNLTAAELAIKGQQAIEQEQAKARKTQFAAETYAEQFNKRFNEYSESPNQLIQQNASNLADFEVRNIGRPYVQLRYDYDPKTKGYKPNYNVVPKGAITYDLTTGMALRRDRKTGEFIELDPFTLERINTGAE